MEQNTGLWQKCDYVNVHILDIPYHVDRPYTYYLPPEIPCAARGCFVLVPFGNGNRHVIGVVTELIGAQKKQELGIVRGRCKPVFEIISEEFLLTEEMLSLCVYLKEMTFCTIGDAAKTVLPAGALRRLHKVYTLPEGAEETAMTVSEYAQYTSVERDILAAVAKRGSLRRDRLTSLFGAGAAAAADRMVQKGHLRRTAVLSEGENCAVREWVGLAAPRADAEAIVGGDRAAKARYGYRFRRDSYRALLERLLSHEGEAELSVLFEETGCTRAEAKELARLGLVSYRCEDAFRDPYRERVHTAVGEDPLSEEQSAAVAQLTALYETKKAQAALLFGVTGSGKTRVIRAMMDRVIADGRQVIMMVPEISLTPQSVAIFYAVYGDRAAVVHSGLSAGERLDVWRRARRGELDVVIGTRSAVFVPFDRLGMIVMDEEQEHTYKSDLSPKYHARDAARFRCAANEALLLLASATPSLESYYKAQRGLYSLVRLQNRYGGAALPEVVFADMQGAGVDKDGEVPLGTTLGEAIAQVTARGEQAILFINRRGYHKYLSCLSCKEPVMCPHCSVPMTLHRAGRRGEAGQTEDGTIAGVLVCHYCGTRQKPPMVCPSCGGGHLHAFGYGTQRAERELESRFPQLKTLRMDMDTTQGKLAHERILSGFRAHEADILLGTQMVTKGHDFPNVTLVGVLGADALIHQDDYRASERAFSLLTQVIGRAGRAQKPGRAIIQTYDVNNEILRYAAKQDYDAFYQSAVRMRQAMVFPPFCEMVLLTFVSEEEIEASHMAEEMYRRILSLTAEDGEYDDVRLAMFGPFEAQIYRLNEKYRMRIVIKCRMNRRTRMLFAAVMAEFSERSAGRVSIGIDVNPNTL